MTVTAGDTVQSNQKIGEMGCSGDVYPPGVDGTHLDFRVWDIALGSFINPRDMFVWN